MLLNKDTKTSKKILEVMYLILPFLNYQKKLRQLYEH